MSSYLSDRSVCSYSLLTPPSVEPISLDVAKNHLRLEDDFSADNDKVTRLIRSARAWTEEYLRRALCAQQWRLTLDRFPTWADADGPLWWLFRRGIIELLKPPIRSIDLVTYIDTNGVSQTLVQGTDFIADVQGSNCRLEPVYGSFWPITQFRIATVQIDHTSGYTGSDGDPDNAIPEPIKTAMLLMVGAFYENREAFSGMQTHELPFGVESLLSPYRAIRF